MKGKTLGARTATRRGRSVPTLLIYEDLARRTRCTSYPGSLQVTSKFFLSSPSFTRCPYLAPFLSALSFPSFPRHPFLAVLTSLSRSFPSLPRHPFLVVLTSLTFPSFLRYPSLSSLVIPPFPFLA